jgi:hypothetical protein
MNVYHTYLQKQSALCDLLAEQVSDTAHARWPLATKYGALNHAIRNLGNRLRLPYIYELPSYTGGEPEYSLPAYVQGPFILQFADSGGNYWTDYSAYRVYPGEGGSPILRFEYNPPGGQARIIWWGTNSPIPTTVASLSTAMNEDSTTLTISSAPEVGRAGFVKIGQEWIQYCGALDIYQAMRLNNLVRGVADSTVNEHDSNDNVEWGIAAYNMTAYNQILSEAQAYLHQLYLVRASEQERDKHMTMLRYSKQETPGAFPIRIVCMVKSDGP